MFFTHHSIRDRKNKGFRYWFHCREREDSRDIFSLYFETYLRQLLEGSIGFRVTVAEDEKDLSFALYLVFINFYLSVSHVSLLKFLRKFPYLFENKDGWNYGTGGTNIVKFDFCLNPEHFTVSGCVMCYAMDDNVKRRFPRSFYINIPDLVFGRASYSEKVIEEKKEIFIILPEGRYKATCEIKDSYWKRPRWFFNKIIRRAFINIDKGIPIPGKGDNSWDCDDNAVFGHTGPSDSCKEASDELSIYVLKQRQKYYTLDWVPTKGFESYGVIKIQNS
jgi:hypothetical protein